MNSWRMVGGVVAVFAVVCMLGVIKNSEVGAFQAGDKKTDIKADPAAKTVKPGESFDSTLTLTRGKDVADKEVTLTVEVAPAGKGVSAKLEKDGKVGKEKTAKLTIETKSDAAEADYTVTVSAKTDEATKVDVKVTVKKDATAVKPPDPPKPGEALPFKAFAPDSKPFYTIQSTTTTQDMKVLNQNVQQKQKQEFLIKWTPMPMDKDNWVVEQQIMGVKLDIDIGGNKIKYDSPEINPKNPMTDFFDTLLKQKLKFTIDKTTLKVVKVDGRDEYIKGLSDINPQMRSLLTAILSEAALKKMAEPTWYAYPSDGKFAAGREWPTESDLDLGPIGKYKTTFKFNVKSVDAGKANVDIKTTLVYTAPAEDKKAGLPFIIKGAELKSEGGTGTAIFDGGKGRFESTKLNMKLTGKLQIEVGNMPTTVDLVQDQVATSESRDDEPAEWKQKTK